MKYVYILDGDDSSSADNLVKLGYDPINPKEAYHDIGLLRKKAAEAKMDFRDVLEPMNAAKAMLGARYATNIPLFLKVIDKYGPKKAFDKLLNAESIDEIKNML